MLAAWFRMKYPHIILGSIAASAPVLAFPSADTDEELGRNGEAYWAIVSQGATPAAGASAYCVPALRAAWTIIETLGTSVKGRRRLSAAFGMCADLADDVDIEQLKLYIAMGFDTIAMGNYPYPSDYLTGAMHHNPKPETPKHKP